MCVTTRTKIILVRIFYHLIDNMYGYLLRSYRCIIVLNELLNSCVDDILLSFTQPTVISERVLQNTSHVYYEFQIFQGIKKCLLKLLNLPSSTTLHFCNINHHLTNANLESYIIKLKSSRSLSEVIFNNASL